MIAGWQESQKMETLSGYLNDLRNVAVKVEHQHCRAHWMKYKTWFYRKKKKKKKKKKGAAIIF